MPLTGKFDISKFKRGFEKEINSALGQIGKVEYVEDPDMPDLEYTMGEGDTVESVLKELHSDDYFKNNPGEDRRFETVNRSLLHFRGSLKGKKLMIPYYMFYSALFHFNIKFPEYGRVRSVLGAIEREHLEVVEKIDRATGRL